MIKLHFNLFEKLFPKWLWETAWDEIYSVVIFFAVYIVFSFGVLTAVGMLAYWLLNHLWRLLF